MTATMLALAPDPAGTRCCRWCRVPVVPCPMRAEGYVTGCRDWVHVPPPGREHGRHYCGTTGTGTQAVPEKREDGHGD